MKGTIKTIVGFVSVATDSPTVEVAGDVTTDGAPVNLRSFKVSRSKKNEKSASDTPFFLSKHEHNGQTFYMLESMMDDCNER